ncbi:hypothetical protein COLO4_10776 [Corchorus olitorius]|uniref:Uncharacterized protein n=1 Tax=Corchorus olitorius TaxID=93759 RepID=A0A1R3K733_9ROSI|nr:hypothetical protein COLO4_10776 [Corchorus olitorius]
MASPGLEPETFRKQKVGPKTKTDPKTVKQERA